MAKLCRISFLLLLILSLCAKGAVSQDDDEEYDEDYDEDAYDDDYYEDYEDYKDEDYDYNTDEPYTTTIETRSTRPTPTTSTRTPWWLTTTLRRTARPTPRVESITPGPTVRKIVQTPRPGYDHRRDPNRTGDHGGRYEVTTRPTTRSRYTYTRAPTRSRYDITTRSPTRSRYETPTRSPTRSRYETPTRSPTRSRYETPTRSPTRSRYGSETTDTRRSRYETTTRAATRSRYDSYTRSPTRSRYDSVPGTTRSRSYTSRPETRATPRSRYEMTTSRYNRQSITREPSRTRNVGSTVDPRYQRITPRRYFATTEAPSRGYDPRGEDSSDEDPPDCGCEVVRKLRDENIKIKDRLDAIEKTMSDLGETVVKVDLDSENWKRSLRFPGLTAIKSPSNIVMSDAVISDRKYKDCQDVQDKGNKQPGVYGIMPDNSAFTTFAYCQDGWTFIQRRYDGSVPFNRSYDEYVKGFGNFSGEFWLGLENMHLLTTQDSYTLRVDMETSNTKFYYAMYNEFRIENETEGYSLQYGNMTAGNLGDGLTTARGRPFSTRDRDRDNWGYGNCAQFYHSGFWLDRCGTDLNRIPKFATYGGMRWDRVVVKSSLMRIKPTRDVGKNEFKLVP